MKDEFNLESTIGVTLDSWNDLYQKSGVYSAIFSELVCVVSKYPKKVHRDGNNRLHNVNGPSVEWSRTEEVTAFDCYYIHGVNIDPKTWGKLKEKNAYTFEYFVKESNEEVKSAILAYMEEKLGGEYLFRFISDNLKEIDTYTHKKDAKYMEGTTKGMNIGVYTLFKGNVNSIDLAFVRCYCPSTDRLFFLSVDPINKNAKDAIASLYRCPAKLIKEIKYIQRQGERFSTVFTDRGKALLKEMSEAEISDLTHISGSRYFNLMQYEY